MGITLIQKSDLKRVKRNPKVALVLCGGAISGGAFKLGGLIALNSFLANRKTTDMDLYLGISAGAFLSAPLCRHPPGGVVPQHPRGKRENRSIQAVGFRYPNWKEWVFKTGQFIRSGLTYVPRVSLTNARYIRKNRRALRARADDLIKKPTYKNFERLLEPLVLDALAAHELPPWYDSLPSGLFDNSKIERFMRRNLERNGLPNTFRLMKLERSNELYICATNLNTAEGVVFGHDEDTSVTISQAVQASTAIPGFFKPATLNGVDYLDAGVRKQRISPSR